MNIWYSCIIAFAMYSRVPVPTAEWTKERMRYVFCFFPCIGILCGAGLWCWLLLADWIGFSSETVGLIGTAIPIFITGGIHMDGFLDTIDALSSYGDKEKKLEILKDPHTGAFAIIGCGAYLLCYSGLMIQWAEMTMGRGDFSLPFVKSCLALGTSFVLERVFSGLSVASFPCAKGTGLAAAFADSAHKKTVRICLFLWMSACLFVLVWTAEAVGLAVGISQAAVWYWYYRMSKKNFGGITGDLAGWFLQVSEAVSLLVLTAGFQLFP